MPLVYAVCLRYLSDRELAKDAVMDIFDGLIRKVREHEIKHFRPWLYTVARNHCLMQLRKVGTHRIVPLETDGMQSDHEMHREDEAEREWQLQRLTKCIGQLSPDQQQSISLFYLEQKCYKDIAVITGMDWNRVRSLIQNGRRNLKKCMEQ